MITLARAKESIPHASAAGADDARLTSLIAVAEAAVERYCSRRFAATAHSEVHTPTPHGVLYCDQFPIASGPTIRYPVSAVQVVGPARSSVDVISTGLSLSTGETLAWASYTTLSALAGAISAVSGWMATVVAADGNYPSSRLVRVGGRDTASWTVLSAYLQVAKIQQVDHRTGGVWLADADSAESCRVDYTAGFDPIPADVQEAVALVVRDLFDGANRDADRTGPVSSETLGAYSVSFAERAGEHTELPPVVRRMLAPYRVRRP